MIATRASRVSRPEESPSRPGEFHPDRLTGNGGHTIADERSDACVRGLHHIEVRDQKGDVSEATLEIKYSRIQVLPIRKQNPQQRTESDIWPCSSATKLVGRTERSFAKPVLAGCTTFIRLLRDI